MTKLISALVLSLALAGCAAFNTQTKQVQAACATATAGINVLADHADQLTDAQKTAALEAVAVLNPICGEGAAPVYDDVTRAILSAAIAKLTTLQESIK